MRDERGLALPLTLWIMMILASLGVGLLAVGAMEPQISRNVADGTQARFAADAGVEWAYNSLIGTADWNTLLVGADPVAGVTLASDSAIPGLGPSRGTYTVRLRNDTLAGDPAYTGVAVDGGGPTTDTNGRVFLIATGAVGTATRTVQVVVQRAALPPLPSALGFPGNEAQTSFSGNSFEVDGNDWTYNADTGTGTQTNSCARVFGVSTYTSANEGVVEASLASAQQDNVFGKNQSGTGNAQGSATVASDLSQSPADIASFIAQAKKAADISLISTQAAPLSYSGIGSSCATNVNSPTCWGTPTNPKIVYVKGDPDPTSNFSALQLSGGSTGYGILIVEDGDLRISGNFNWSGIIIVSGQWVGVGFLGGGNQAVYGSVVSNETSSDAGFYEGVLVGNAKVRYSCAAIDLARKARKLVTMNWREVTQ